MKTRTSYPYIIFGLFLFAISVSVNTADRNFALPPSELIMIDGDSLENRLLTCQVKADEKENYHLLSFISESGTSIVNNLVLPEGTIMSLSFHSLESGKLTIELKEGAHIGITNDTEEFIKLICSEHK
ncbi:hypothetical protein [Legionella saoudiensis]|uniref:hypothetical protein n=1 Tax=Legionella saoudiensis TaxID=1750561 RepID=UPI0007314D82|nr:hypothetical protein [Legionella saoudiensis]